MSVHRIKQGLRLPIAGSPQQAIDSERPVAHVALVGADYVGLRPTMHAEIGASVERGQLLFEDKKTPGVRFTAPVAGTVVAINRGERRVFESLVIAAADDERSGRGAQVALASFTGRQPASLNRDEVVGLLLESGLWPTLRARPFSRVADPATRPRSIFVTAIDTDPLAPDVDVVLAGREGDIEAGVSVLAALTDGPVFFCTSASSALGTPRVERVRHERFDGPHPAGTVGVHIHRLDPAGRDRLVWHVGYQDVAAIGRLFRTGEIETTRVVALSGPAMQRPRLVRTLVGASTDELTRGELEPGEVRVISGSVLSGRAAAGPVHGYLGRFDRQVSALVEGRTRELLGWAGPGRDRYSALRVFVSAMARRAGFEMTTSTHGSPRAIIPIGVYEKVMPFDTPATFLLKALVTHDVVRAEQLGCLELDEEDLALCTFVCPSKIDYGPHLRAVLAAIEKDA